MFHVLAFAAAALDQTAGDVQEPAVSDDVFSIRNNSFQIPFDMNLFGVYSAGLNKTRARIKTASLISRGFPQIWPFSITVLPPNPIPFMDLRDMPITLRREEDFRVDGSAPVAVGNNVSTLAFVSDAPFSGVLPYRDLRILRFTANVTAVAQAWSNLGAITFQDTLEGGQYAICGMHVQGANVIAARLQLQNQVWRPGCIGNAAAQSQMIEYPLMGGFGVWGMFNTYSLPQIQSLENAAGASALTGWLLCAKAS